MATVDDLTLRMRADISQAQDRMEQLRQSILNATDTASITRLNRQLTSLGNDMRRNLQNLNSGNLNSQSVVPTIDIVNGMNMVSGVVSSISDKFNIMGKIASIAFDRLKVGMEQFIKAGFEFNKSMEQNTIAFETLLGSEEKAAKLMNDLSVMAAKTPFEFPELASSTKQLLAMGFAAEGMPWVLKNIGDAAAATGLGAEGLNRITRAIAQMKAKGKISAEEMTGQLGEIVPAWDILAKKMGKSIAEVQKMSKDGALDVNKSLELLLEGFGERFPGLMEKMSSTFDGMLSTIKDNLQQVSGFMQASFFDAIKIGMADVVEATSYMLDVSKQFKDPLLAIQATIQKTFGKDVLNAIMPFIYGIVELFNAVKTIISTSFEAIAPIIIGVMQKLAPIFLILSSFVNGLANAFSSMSPTMQSIVVIAGLLFNIFIAILPAIVTLGATIAGVAMALLSFGKEIGIAILAIIGLMSNIFLLGAAIVSYGMILYNVIQKNKEFRDAIVSVFENIYESISVVINNVILIFSNLFGFLQEGFSAVFPILVKIVAGSFMGILLILNEGLRVFAGFTEILAGTFTGNWAKVWNGVKMIFGNIFNSILSIGEAAINALLKLVNFGIEKLNTVKMPEWIPIVGGKKIELPKLGEVSIPRVTWDSETQGKNIGLDMMKGIKASFSKSFDILESLKKFKLPKIKDFSVDTSKPQKLFSDISKGMNDAAKGVKKAKDKSKDAAEEMQKQLDKVTNKLESFIGAVQKQADSIIDFGNLFERVIEKKFSGEKLIRAIKSQLSVLDKWKESLASIGKRIGTNSALYQELLSRGPEAAGEIQALSKLSNTKLQSYEGLFEQKRAVAYEMGYKMEAADSAKELSNKQMVINITGNKISDELDVDIIANKMIQKLKVAGVY